MKKFFAAIFLLLILSSASYAAASEDMKVQDVYVRQDVFDAKMEAFMNEIRGEFQVINTKLAALDKRIDDFQAATAARIDDLQASTSSRFDDLQASMTGRINDLQAATSSRFDDLQASMAWRIDDVKTIVYWGLSILGLLIAFAIFGPSFGEFLRNLRTPSITIEDVKRLIAEAKLGGVSQV